MPPKKAGKSKKALDKVKAKKKDGKNKPAAKKGKAAKKPAAKAPKKALKKTENDYEPINTWWEKPNAHVASDIKWENLEHHGLAFPEDYEKHNVALVYDGRPVKLEKGPEELASYYTKCMGSEYEHKEKFIANFWEAFMKTKPPAHITDFKKCDFSLMKKHFDAEREARNGRSKEEKQAEKAEKDTYMAHFKHCVIDGIREACGAVQAEPPQLFRGRGDHPKAGKLKRRLVPEGVTMNIGKDAPAPKCMVPGHSWSDVVHDNTVTWLGFYKDTVNDQFKYLMLAPSSGMKGQPDLLKYEKARKLIKVAPLIRADYEKKWGSQNLREVQIGVTTYLVDKLALRAGNEKDTEEAADTVGCCSLRVEHCTMIPDGHKVKFDFLGKDSIRYENTVSVDPKAWEGMKRCMANKKPTDMIFDKCDPGTLNEYFEQFPVPGLSVKVFRTYNASITLDSELAKYEADVKKGVVDPTNPQSIYQFYENANRQVAILCNHQKAVSKSHGTVIEKMTDQLKQVQNQLKEMVKHSKKPKAGVESKFGGPKLPSNKDACETKITQLEKRVQEQERKIQMKEDNKTTSLGTSKANYMDPRISVAFCKMADLPIEKVFTGVLRNKFPWAMYTPSSFRWD